MKLRFWGTRGSIAKAGPSTVHYGGNTSCVEVRADDGTLLILDCGTGAHGLGMQLMEEGAAGKGHVLISHTHWDHIQGLPFFTPFFVPGNEWHVHGPRGLGPSLREVLAGQMEYTYFPVSLDQLGAEVEYHDLVEGTFEIGGIRVTTQYLNHPALTLGYRLEADGVTVVYATDHEPHLRHLADGGEAPEGSEDEKHGQFIADADLVIHDTQYVAAEYPDRVGWGHSTMEYVVDLSCQAAVRKLALFHHDPMRSDEALRGMEELAIERARSKSPNMELFAAREGPTLEIKADGRPRRRAQRISGRSAIAGSASHLGTFRVLLVGNGCEALRLVEEAAEADSIELHRADGIATALAAVADGDPSVLVACRRLSDGDALELAQRVRSGALPSADELPIVIVAGEDDLDLEGGHDAGVTDWLTVPFSSIYARTRIRAWAHRTSCRWRAAPLPPDEDERLEALHRLGLLDTPPEERFDRHTRIAAKLFDVKTVVVNLVDRDRQWTKSAHGAVELEAERDVSFCAHTILSEEVLQVSDALRHPAFADNPMVTGGMKLRFYAGVPLALRSGHRVGTLCLIDPRPKQLSSAQLEMLQDLADIVQRELEA